MIKEGVKRMVSSLSTLYENFIVVHWTKPSNMEELKHWKRVLKDFENNFKSTIFSKLK